MRRRAVPRAHATTGAFAFTVCAVVLAVGLVSTACSGADVDQPPAADVPVTGDTAASVIAATTVVPVVDEEAAVLAAVDGYWQTVLAANNPPDPNHPDLARFMTGEALDRSRDTTVERQQFGQAVRLPDYSIFGGTVEMISIEEHASEVTYCLIDDAILVDVPSGIVLNDKVSVSRLSIHLLKEATWKVAKVVSLTKSEVARSCDQL